jgi:hypothetical protein
MDVWATIPGRAGRARIGTAEREGDTVRLRLDALPAGDAVLELDLPALAAGEALLSAVGAANPLYGEGRASAVSVWRDGKQWCASRCDDLTLERRAKAPAAALAALTARLSAEAASQCPKCGAPVLTSGHDETCPRNRRKRAERGSRG